jgi:hypothetical protein
MFPVTSRVMRSRNARCYGLHYQSRRAGEAVTVDNDALYVSHAFTESGRVVPPLSAAARRLEAIEDAVAAPLAAA